MSVKFVASGHCVGRSGECDVPPRPRNCGADEARRFIAGKHFSYNCFEGTNGHGRIYADGSVAGYIQIGGSGPRRYVVLPAGTLRVQRRRNIAPRCAASRSSPASTSTAPAR